METRGAAGVPALGFVGAGRAGSAMAVALHAAGFPVAAVCSRTPAHATALSERVGARIAPTPQEVVERSDLAFLTVPDAAIAAVADSVAAASPSLHGKSLVHCSARLGAVELNALGRAGAEVGVVHPLQAMAGAESAAGLRGAYFRVEASAELEPVINGVVGALGGTILRIPAAQRDLYHAAAVLAGNAPLALLARATALLEACGLDEATAHDALARLLEGAAANARRQQPEMALTGPVVRGDREAISAHRAALAPYPDALSLYNLLVDEMERLLLPEQARSTDEPSLHRVA